MKAVFFENLPYASHFHVGSHHYADAFAADGWDLFWVSHPLSPLHYVHPDKKDFEVRHKGWREGPLDYGRIRYYSPLTLMPAVNRPILRSPLFAENAARATVPSLPGVLRREGFGSPDLVWLTNAIYLPLVRRMKPKAVAVRVADDNAAFRDIPRSFADMERRSIRSADVVFAVAEELYERLSSERGNVVHLPNAVDFEHFAAPRPEPADLAAIPRPRVIYVGSTAYWFDAELVERTARALPDAHFVIVGPVSPEVASLGSLPNVHVLGPHAYEDVPAYMQHADAGIVPFRDIPLVHAVQPIKLFEYLACGLPVVASRWRELERMRTPAALAAAGEFADAVRAALAEGGSRRDEYVTFARANSWAERYRVVRSAIAPFVDAPPT